MAVTRINNNQISDAVAGNVYVGVNAAAKLQNYSITSQKIANGLVYGSDLTVSGNLTVNGQTTTIDTTVTTIEDPVILLASNQSGSPSVDIGFIGERGTSDNIAFVWDESADEFVTAFTSTGETNTTITISSYANFHSNDANIGGNIVINGTTSAVGNINGSGAVLSGNITGGNILTGGQVSATGNVTGGNINTVGNVNSNQGYFTGNVTVVGTFTSTSNIVANTSGIFYGNAVTGNDAIYAGLPTFTPLGTNVVAQFTGNVNSYSQINFENISNGNRASTDYIATADNGTDTTNYADFGINSSTFNDPVNYPGYGPNDSYVHNHGGNLILNPESSGKTIKLMVGGTADGNVVANVSTTGIAVTGVVSASGNVTGGNVTTGGLVTATGNVTGSNITTGGVVSATGNVIGGNLVSSGAASVATVTATGNITGGNLITTGVTQTGTLTTTGNATVGGNLIVQGNITYINIDDLRVEDPIIILGTGPNGAPLTVDDGMDRGVYMEYYKTGLGNAYMGWENSSGNILMATSVNFSANNVVNVLQYGTLQAGNLYVESASVVGNVAGGNLNTAGQVVATANITGGNILTAGLMSATSTITSGANVIGANLVTGGLVTATGNVIGGNITTGGQVVATSTITGGNLATAGTASAGGNITGANLITGGLVTATGNVIGGNITTAGQVVATANITGGNILTAGLMSSTGNIDGGNLRTAGQVTATGNITGGNLILTSGFIDSTASRITINGSDGDVDFAVDGDTAANVFYVDAGTGTASFGSSTQTTGAIVAFNTSNSILMPVGNTAQRPSGVVGMLRFNSIDDALETYTSSGWETVGVPVFTVVADEQFNGDGSTVVFTLGSSQTTASCIVSINGVVQLPTVAYSVSGTTLTFTEAPQPGDVIDVRQITTTTTVIAISNTSGNAVIGTSPTASQIDITGNVVPTANVAYNLGTSSLRWKDLYLSGNSIILGNTVMKNTSGNTIGFFGPDGTTPATIASSSIDTTTIANGTSNVAVASSGGNVRVNVGGTSNVGVFSTTGLSITGDLSVTGNATLSGNILGDRVQNGNTSFDIQTQNGNANITVGGTSNVAVFSTSGVSINGNLNLTGNIVDSGPLFIITGSNGNIDLAPNGTGNVNIGGNIMPAANATANIGSATLSFNTIFAKATSAQYADLAEKYTADAEYAPGTVVCFGGSKEVTVTSADADRKVAGVVSTNPSYIMNGALEAEYVATVALTGRVPCRVTGTVRKGDLMVSAGYGLARAEADPRVGTVIGKALADFDGQEGVIEVVVGRF